MIEFHESEYSHFALSDLQMMQVAFLLGPECATKLLYGGDQYARLYRLDPARDRINAEKRSFDDDVSGPFDIFDSDVAKESETAPIVASSTMANAG